jgi:hypothetical protein
MGSALKSIGKIGASFIPGVGGILGSVLGAIGGSGKQGEQKYNSTTSQTIDQTTTPTEAGYFGAGREGLTGGFMDFLRQQDQPIYGNAAKASVFNDLNDLAQDSIGKIRGQLGGNSGFKDSAIGDIERQRYGGLADFLTKLPGMESEAQFARKSNLYGQGMNFFGRAPVGQTVKGTTSSTGSGSQAQYGQGFGGGLASNLGGILGAQAGMGGDGGWGSLFGGGRPALAQGQFSQLPLFGFNGPKY